MARQRLITLLGLTSLVAMMITITRFSSSFSEPSVRLMITQKKLFEYQQRLRLIASEQNSNKTINNLLENLIKTKTELQSKLDSVNSDVSIDNQVVPKTVSPSRVSSSSSSQPPVQSLKNNNNQDDLLVPIISSQDSSKSSSSGNSNINVPIAVIEPKPGAADSEPKALTSGSKPPATEKPVKADAQPIQPKTRSKTNQNSRLNSINSVKSTALSPKLDIDLNVDNKSFQSNQKLQELDNLENNENKLNKVKIKPKLVFDAEDLKTTESMKIDKPLGCEEDLGASLDLLVIVNSAVDHWEARRAVRETWGRFAVERGATLFFLIGSTTNSTLQKQVMAEEERNGDLLQGHFIDNYFNLTLKTISLMRWISDRCYKVKYVLKIDDDMFVNMQHIADFTETRSFTKCIIGKLAKKWKPHRNTNNKWYVPIDAFNGTQFPSFATGPAYMISGDAVRPLYEWSIKLRPFYLEDVYMTGIVAEKARIRRLNHGMMTNVHIKDINACNFAKFMTSHKHSPQDIRRLWKLVYSQPEKPCGAPKTTAKPKPANSGPNGKSVTQPKPKPVLNAG